MPKWLIPVLSWGGSALAILCAVGLIVLRLIASTDSTQVKLFWYGLVVGVIVAGIGFLLGRRKA